MSHLHNSHITSLYLRFAKNVDSLEVEAFNNLAGERLLNEGQEWAVPQH